jgi:hypothetical protein
MLTGRNTMTYDPLIKAVENEASSEDPGRLLVLVKGGKIVHVNISLLAHFLDKHKKKSMYISIDRPHKYIELLLRKKNIPHEHLVFVDITTRSPAKASETRSMLKVGGFFWLKLIANSLDSVYLPMSKKCDNINLQDFCVILLDNAAVLPAYNSEESISEFFEEFKNIIEKHEHMCAIVVAPKDLHDRMKKILRDFSTKEIDVKDEWLR